MAYDHVTKLIKDHAIEFVDLRFADMRGVQHHVTFPANIVEPALFEDGKMFDGSSISGWKGINESDMMEEKHIDRGIRVLSKLLGKKRKAA